MVRAEKINYSYIQAWLMIFDIITLCVARYCIYYVRVELAVFLKIQAMDLRIDT